MPAARPAPAATAVAAFLALAAPALAEAPPDPLGSVMWEVLAPAVFGDAPVVFDGIRASS